MHSSAYTVLVTGANRGLGNGLAQRFLEQPGTTVIAGVRDIAKSSQALQDLRKGKDSKIIVVKIDSCSGTDAADAVKEIQDQGIEHLDLVIANARVSYIWPAVRDLDIEDLQGHIDPNVYGPIRLFQATRGLLSKSSAPKWVTMGSSAGLIDELPPITNAAYAPSKVMIHWLTKKIDAEEEVICAFVMDPGWTQTDMGNTGALHFGMEQAPISVSTSCDGIVRVVREATKKSHGGKLIEYTGRRMAW